ncbi:MAG TPA: YciI family protein [Pyrinomonadaceae bacterium]
MLHRDSGSRHHQVGIFLQRSYLIEANDLDEAIGVAERIPPARFGTVEIRPVMEIGELPEN